MTKLSSEDLVRDLRARRIMVDGGNGNVYDVADEVCEQPASPWRYFFWFIWMWF